MLRDRVRNPAVAGATPTRSALVNHRRAAGASIAHPHAQVVALDFVPPEVLAAEQRAAAASDDLLDARPRVRSRHDAVLTDGSVSRVVPVRRPGLRICVRVGDPEAGGRFDQASDGQLARFALALPRRARRAGADRR